MPGGGGRGRGGGGRDGGRGGGGGGGRGSGGGGGGGRGWWGWGARVARQSRGGGAAEEAGQEGRVGKSPRTWEEWAPYGIGEPDEYGIYPDYRTPEAFAKEASGRGVSVPWSALMDDWETVVLDVQAVFGEVWHRCLGEP